MRIWRSNDREYALISKVFHWLTAVAVVALFVVGWWMVDLGYYDPWYTRAPALHISFGVLLAILVVARLAHRLMTPAPAPLSNHRRWERLAAKSAHILLYLGLLAMFLTGYLLVTGQGDALPVFDWFILPALVDGGQKLVDFSGDWHEYIAWALIILAALHALAALKHHFWDKDDTLRRMITRSKS